VSKTQTRLENKARSLTGPYLYRPFQSMLYKQREKWHESLRVGHHEKKNNVLLISFKKLAPEATHFQVIAIHAVLVSRSTKRTVVCGVCNQRPAGKGQAALHSLRQGHPSSTRHSIKRNCPDQEPEANLAWIPIGDLLRSTNQMIRQSLLYGPFLLMTCKCADWDQRILFVPILCFRDKQHSGKNSHAKDINPFICFIVPYTMNRHGSPRWMTWDMCKAINIDKARANSSTMVLHSCLYWWSDRTFLYDLSPLVCRTSI
jgi:hypothetical protein